MTDQMVHTLLAEVFALNQQVGKVDLAIEARFREHRAFKVITSMPGLGVILGAELLAATGGDMTAFGTADRLVGFGGAFGSAAPGGAGRGSGRIRADSRSWVPAAPLRHREPS
ncbi:transposase [Streptomyces sp. NPDC005899]|uniref:transposase n=1 Tax=Streptomyces sp. NPDC005899 TaxID=3155716 RepID=UPI0033F5D1A2